MFVLTLFNMYFKFFLQFELFDFDPCLRNHVTIFFLGHPLGFNIWKECVAFKTFYKKLDFRVLYKDFIQFLYFPYVGNEAEIIYSVIVANCLI